MDNKSITVDSLLIENQRRYQKLKGGFNPISGIDAPLDRVLLSIPDYPIAVQYVPVAMMQNRLIVEIAEAGSIENWCVINGEIFDESRHEEIIKAITKIRCAHDFCYWAFLFVKIKAKEGGDNIPFKLRYEQRKLLTELEVMRLANMPIRIILLKARQWGGSTLVQMYIVWIQLLHREGFYSTIVAQTKDVSRKIKGMFTRMLENYPAWLLDIEEDKQLKFSPFEGSQSDFIVTMGDRGDKVRNTVVTIGTYENPDATRGSDTALIHYSEVAMWSSTMGKKPEDLIRSITGGLLNAPLTVEVMESTANGTGNFFHTEWLRAKNNESSRKAVFVAWWEIENDTAEVENEIEFAKWLIKHRKNESPIVDTYLNTLDAGTYIWYMWTQGATFQGIKWYIEKRRSFSNHSDMASEAPTDDVEAFAHSGHKTFNVYEVELVRGSCKEPKMLCDISYSGVSMRDVISSAKFKQSATGAVKIWEEPEYEPVSDRYVVVVDIGGRARTSDYSVIVVIDRFALMYGGVEEIVAQWRGHLDHDKLAVLAAQISYLYNKALLVFESNTLEKNRDPYADSTTYLLDLVSDAYDNLYAREASAESIAQGKPTRWGFHTNRQTKVDIITNLTHIIRDNKYIERDTECCNEYINYEVKPNGSFGAIDGRHDDILMTRAIGLWISAHLDKPGYIVDASKRYGNYNRTVRTESTI